MKYAKPSTQLLEYHNESTKFTNRDYVKALGEDLSKTLQAYKVDAVVKDCRMTPLAAMFDVIPGAGVSIKAFRTLRSELELWLASPVEIMETGSDTYTIGIAIKNWNESPTVGLREILESDAFKKNDYELPIAAGVNVMGKPFVFDLAAQTHLLIAGTTGSGKSVFLNDLIMSLIYSKGPEEVKFAMVDPKRVELCAYNSIPHMLMPVISETKKAMALMNWIDAEMDDRYQKFADAGVRKLEDYNAKVSGIKLPRIVIVVDEYMEMMFKAPKELENHISRISRMARAAGIHLVLATQRPSADVVTSSIKSNIPCRASFTVLDWRESKTILDRTGAERLLGNGDMLFSSADAAVPIHAQAAYITGEEVDRVVENICK